MFSRLLKKKYILCPTPVTLSFLLNQPLWKVLNDLGISMGFGEKDWQQIAVIKRLVPYIGSTTQIVECPIIRDADGLAKSSRNTLLSADERLITPKIYQVLSESLAYAQDHTVEEVRNYVESGINSEEMLNVEYFEIVDGNTLLPVDSWNDSPYIVGCITVYCGRTPIRLIDHIKYKG